MKQLILFTIAAFMVVGVFAQSPEKMSYQAVVRDAKGILVTNQTIGMRISIEVNLGMGITVYSETQNPTTNSNGLVSIEVGNGNVINGIFSTIDWSEGEYFIKTEIDPAGGTNYTITGMSQLLSVPYALHAKTAETIAGGITEDDIVGGITKADGSETKVTGGTDISVTGSGTTGNPYVIGSTKKTLAIGDHYQGGIIFWLDETGQHGLIAATEDQKHDISWNNGIRKYTGIKGDGLYAGEMNTAMIVSLHISDNPNGNFAAKVCADYVKSFKDVTTGRWEVYGDWYLPSAHELDKLYLQKDIVGGFVKNEGNSRYWSSTENSGSSARFKDFKDGSWGITDKSQTFYVRAIRAF